MKERQEYKDTNAKALNVEAVKRLQTIEEPLTFAEATEVLFATVSRRIEELEARVEELEDELKNDNTSKN